MALVSQRRDVMPESMRAEIDRATVTEIVAYLDGASRDGTFNRLRDAANLPGRRPLARCPAKSSWFDDVVRAKRARRLPVVLTRDETRAVLDQLRGVPRLMALLLYGAGLRVLECARLRVKDVDLASNQIVVRAGKGGRDRVTMLPAAVKASLAQHLELARRQHERDLARGAGWVELPGALLRKYPSAGRDWAWQ